MHKYRCHTLLTGINAKSYVNKMIHALLMTRFAPSYIQHSGQQFINTEANASLQLQVSMIDLYSSVLQIWILEKWKSKRH